VDGHLDCEAYAKLSNVQHHVVIVQHETTSALEVLRSRFPVREPAKLSGKKYEPVPRSQYSPLKMELVMDEVDELAHEGAMRSGQNLHTTCAAVAEFGA
jgi:hypothetical protein